LLNTETGSLKIWRELLEPFETAMLVEMQRQVQTALENTSEEKICWGRNYCAVEDVQVIAEEELVNHFLHLEQ